MRSVPVHEKLRVAKPRLEIWANAAPPPDAIRIAVLIPGFRGVTQDCIAPFPRIVKSRCRIVGETNIDYGSRVHQTSRVLALRPIDTRAGIVSDTFYADMILVMTFNNGVSPGAGSLGGPAISSPENTYPTTDGDNASQRVDRVLITTHSIHNLGAAAIVQIVDTNPFLDIFVVAGFPHNFLNKVITGPTQTLTIVDVGRITTGAPVATTLAVGLVVA